MLQRKIYNSTTLRYLLEVTRSVDRTEEFFIEPKLELNLLRIFKSPCFVFGHRWRKWKEVFLVWAFLPRYVISWSHDSSPMTLTKVDCCCRSLPHGTAWLSLSRSWHQLSFTFSRSFSISSLRKGFLSSGFHSLKLSRGSLDLKWIRPY